MRIISGKHKSRRLQAPKNLPESVRPTTDISKEALFNILNNYYYFDEVSVLDLFAGTGNISYEFASRGSETITCVDADAKCIQYISKTAKELEFQFQVIKSDVFKFLENAKIKATVIFADPPYSLDQEKFEAIPMLIFKNNFLEENGLLIIEHSKHTSLDHLPQFSFSKKYGGSIFSFFEY